MAMKFTILVSILVVVLIAAQADAQGPSPTVVFNISGIVSCSVNGSLNAPPFPNAQVQLSCGGNVIASAVTNAQGAFNITVTPAQVTLPNLLSSCKITVPTPLANCNAALPSSGSLQALLQFAGNTIVGLLNILNLVPIGFQLDV